ncbi:hypothetical protein WMY93_004067 [Mugilogobius chulae]|uniref:Uncharacterized protein n=1 Tax=Mugilogobius chulae TaxID=88201 RepID=A0AAW0PX69_9GOBI
MKEHGRTGGPWKNEAVRGSTWRPVGERDGLWEYGAAVGERDGPWENGAARGRTTVRGRTRRSRGIGIAGTAREMRRIAAMVTQNCTQDARMSQHTYRRKEKAEGACPDAVWRLDARTSQGSECLAADLHDEASVSQPPSGGTSTERTASNCSQT